jgi:hypothetical protein
MTSQILINPNLINENFPVRGANNDSQGFRDNFLATKNAFLTARSEIDTLHNTTLVLSGDAIGTSSAFGNSTTVNLDVTLRPQSNVIPSTYNTATHTLALTVNNKGLITNVVPTPIQVTEYTGVEGVWSPSRQAYVSGGTNNGVFTLPSFSVNRQGQIVAASWVNIPNYGILGHQLTRGYLVVGDNNNQSNYLTLGSNGQVLMVDNTQPYGVRWGNVSGGATYTHPTYTGVDGMYEPIINNITGQITYPTFTVNDLGHIISTGTKVIDDFGIYDHALPRGNILVGDSSDFSVSFPPGSDGQVLTADSSEGTGLRWATLVTGNPASGEGTTVVGNTVNLSIQSLVTTPTLGNNDLILYRDDTIGIHRNITFNNLSTQINNSIKVERDASPILGGNLDVREYSIFSTHSLGVNIYASGRPLKFQGHIWPALFPNDANTKRYYLSVSSTGVCSWYEHKIVKGGIGVTITSPVDNIDSETVNLDITKLYDYNNDIRFDDYIAMYRNSDSLHGRVKLGNLFASFGTNVLIVDASRGSPSGNGSLVNPYNNITNAFNAASNNHTIIVFPGTYTDNILFLSKVVKIIGFGAKEEIKLTGVYTIHSLTTSTLYFENVTFDHTARTALDTTGAISSVAGSNSAVARFSRCVFLRGSGALSLLPIINLNGDSSNPMMGSIILDDCIVQGKIVNNLVSSSQLDALVINNIKSNHQYRCTVETNNTSKTLINGGNQLNYIRHIAGYLEITNIQYLLGHPNNSSSMEALYSSAPNISENCLIIRNSSCHYDGDFFTINKTGTCKYKFIDLIYDDYSSITGIKLVSGSPYANEVKQVFRLSNTSPTTSLNVGYYTTFNITLTNNTTISFDNFVNWDDSGYNQGGMVITVILVQNSTGGYTVTWPGNITWDAGANTVITTANSTSIFEFRRYGNGTNWYGKRIFNT